MSFLNRAKKKIVEEAKEAGGKAKGSVQEGGVLHEAGEKVGAAGSKAGGKVKDSLKEGGAVHEGAEKVGGVAKKAGKKVAEETKEAAGRVKDKIDLRNSSVSNLSFFSLSKIWQDKVNADSQ